MALPPRDKSFQGLLKDHDFRISLVERRLASAGTGGSSGGGGGSAPYDALAGIIVPFGGGTVPSGWLLCDGSAVSRTAYPYLFTAIGTTHGAGDGIATFNLPNLKGRVPVGRDTTQTEFDVLGEVGGEKAHVLTIPEMPSHSHGPNVLNYFGMWALNTIRGPVPNGTGTRHGLTADAVTSTDITGVTGSTGGGGAHNNLQPYAVTNYIISTGSAIGGGGSSIPALPDPMTAFPTSDNNPISQAAGVWSTMPGATKTLTLADPMWVHVDFGAQISSSNPATYGMIGVAVSGALTLDPTADQGGPGTRFGLTPFNVDLNSRVQGAKTILLPAGTSTLSLQSFRANATVVPTCDYASMIITPIAWAGQPGSVQDVALTGRGTMAANGTTPATGGTTFTLDWATFEGPPGVWSASTPSRFVLNRPGKWRVTGKVRMNGATSGFGYMNIWKNGVSNTQSEDLRAQSGGGSYPQVMDIITSNGTDYVEFRATNSNASQTIQSANALVTLEWIGA